MNIYMPDDDKTVEDVWERPSIFLAGTTDMGDSEDWRMKVIESLSMYDVNVFNPYRRDWDSSWVQRADNPQFRHQVEWELRHLRRADLVLVNILPLSKSPVTLLELGLFIHKSVVVCPKEFYRSGNIQITAEFFDAPFYETLDAGLEHVKSRLRRI